MVREIALTRGKITLVDDEDYVWLSQFKWFAHHAPRVHGEPVWYACRTVNSPQHHGRRTARQILMHREILGLRAGQQGDHRDGDGLNNQRANLRPCTNSLNAANRTRRVPNPSSRFRGVCLHKKTGRWQAQIMVGRANRYLGLFASEEEAARAYDTAAIASFGEYARTNFGAAILGGAPR